MPNDDRAASRRRFLQFLAASPLLAASDFSAIAAETPSRLPDPMIWAPRSLDKLITSPKEAINIFDLEAVAAKNMPPAHFGYVTGGVNDDVTLRANREGFQKFQLRPRRLVDVSKVDMSTEIFRREVQLTNLPLAFRQPPGLSPRRRDRRCSRGQDR